MKKRAAEKKISNKSKGKEIEKKIRTALTSPEENTKKKKSKKVVPKTAKKTATKKVKAERKPEKAGSSEKKKKAVKKIAVDVKKKPAVAEKTATSKKRVKIPPKAAKKTVTKKITVPKAAEKAKAGGETKTEVKKIPPKREEKIFKKVIPIGKKGEIRPGKKEKPLGIVRKAEGVKKPEGVKEGRGVRIGEVAAMRKAVQEEVRAKRIKEEKEAERGYPSIEAKYLPPPWKALPDEYGETGITLMTVDPYKLFAFWELREETLKVFRGEINIKVYDVTGVDLDIMAANSYFDVSVGERIGRCYIDVRPEREYIADIGIIYEGIFISTARSKRVSTPRVPVSERTQLTTEFFYEGTRTGY